MAVDRLIDAKVGDSVWFYDSQQTRYDEAGKYEGRGVWTEYTITGETRQSFIVLRGKFDRKTGEQRETRGYSATLSIAGELDKQDRIWRDTNRHKLADALRKCNDAAILRRVADLLGWKP